jgi:hypothetical protein
MTIIRGAFAAELRTADDCEEFLSSFGSAAEVIGYTSEGVDYVRIGFGESHANLTLPMTGSDLIYYYGLLVSGQPTTGRG